MLQWTLHIYLLQWTLHVYYCVLPWSKLTPHGSSIVSKHVWEMLMWPAYWTLYWVRDWSTFWQRTHSKSERQQPSAGEIKVSLTGGKEKLGVFCLSLRIVWGMGWDWQKGQIWVWGDVRGRIHMETLLTVWDKRPVSGLVNDSAEALEFMRELYIELRREKWPQARVSYALASLFYLQTGLFICTKAAFELSKKISRKIYWGSDGLPVCDWLILWP